MHEVVGSADEAHPLGSDRPRYWTRRNIIKNAIGAGIVGIGAYQYSGRHRLEIRRATLRLERWRADGLKVALVSDFHINYESEIGPSVHAVECAVQEQPDVILLGGDYLNFRSSLPFVRKWLGLIDTGRIPTFAILGNHDYWSEAVPALVSLFGRTSIRLLKNEVVDLGGATLLGIDDGVNRQDRQDLLSDRTDSGSNLALFHEPDLVERLDPRISLMLAGHSHGGQVCWPFGKPILLPPGARKYWNGFYPQAKVPLFVSRGVGMTGPRFRAFCPPDISILTLRRA